MVRILRNRFNILLAEKAHREGRSRITQEEVAKATGLADNTISRIATNKVKMYDNQVVAALCEYFNCTPGDLLVIEEAEETPDAQPSLQPA